ncbi:MAG: hypothetical protein D6737_19300 [Chloroflexi bacterium]|nr:MAG: hypothetical protein D6737_19300 [Chloroflexota bacterium]
MVDTDLVARYNYDEFTPEKFRPFMNFAASPPAGERGPDFPLWRLEDGSETSLMDIVSQHVLTVVEFGSFT